MTYGLGEWSIIVNDGYWKPRQMDILLIEFLQYAMRGKVSNIMIGVPPRHGKSTLISRNFVSYFLSHFPDEQVILSSYTQSLASEFGGEVKDIIDEYGHLSPYKIGIRKDSKAKNKFHINKPYNGRMLSVGSKGGILGFGAGLFIIDDPIKAEEAESLTMQRKLERWFYRTARSRLEKRKNGLPPIMIIIAQRLHVNDLQGIIKKTTTKDRILDAKTALQILRNDGSIPENTWVDINLPAICTKPEKDILGRKENETLWPEQKGYQTLQAEKESMGTYLFNTIYQGSPRVPEGNMFKRKWFYDKQGNPTCIIPSHLIPTETDRLRYYDTATGGPTGDETSGFLTTYDGIDMYIIHAHNNHYWPNELTQAITTRIINDAETLQTAYMAKIEQEGGSQTGAYIHDLQHTPEILDNNILIRADKVNKLGPKRNRATQLAILAEFGHIYFSDEIPYEEIIETIEQIIDFTGEDGKSDDRVDSLSGSARHWKKMDNRRII